MKVFWCLNGGHFDECANPPYGEIGIEIELPIPPIIGMSINPTDVQKKQFLSVVKTFARDRGWFNKYPLYLSEEDGINEWNFPYTATSIEFCFLTNRVIVGAVD